MFRLNNSGPTTELWGTPKIRSSHLEMFSRKGVLKICSKFTGEHPCRSAISIKLLSNFIEIALRHGYSPVSLLHILRTSFPRNTSGWLFVKNNAKNFTEVRTSFCYLNPIIKICAHDSKSFVFKTKSM